MSRIKVLAEEVTNKIAAGEIIDRPASIVKELVENAIDAKSQKITILLEKGGKKKIHILDDGTGMDEEDALLAFERHATSKIKNVEDIIRISSMGFRGEALPSIASVCKMELITKTEEAETATRIDLNFGKITNVQKCSANKGTEVAVSRLFDNLPVRKKFLKSDQVELKHIINYIHYQALAFPHIGFRLVHNGQERINYPAVRKKMNRYTAVLGGDFLKHNFFPVKDDSDNVSIHGFISGLDEEKTSVSEFRYLFINGRYIRDRIIMHSIHAAYEPFIKKYRIYSRGKLPPFIIFLEINPELVDFNVHPAKLEVRFRDPHLIHSVVKNCLSQALIDYQEEKFQIEEKLFQNEPKGDLSSEKIKPYSTEHSLTHDRHKKDLKNKSGKKINVHKDLEELYQPNLFKSEHQNKKAESSIPTFEQKSAPSDIYIPTEEDLVNPWQLHNSYVLVQCEDGLIIIDQHAAHERILYEKFIHRMVGVPPVTQQLLFPLIIDIPPILADTVKDLLENNSELLAKIGFTIKTFSGESIVINEIPAELSDWEGGEVFKDILYQLQDEFEQTKDFRDSIAKAVSCKAAIKINTRLGRKEMLKLVNDLFACKVPWFCPHGRPVLIKMSLHDLERKFKR